jgi:hypothetical protein
MCFSQYNSGLIVIHTFNENSLCVETSSYMYICIFLFIIHYSLTDYTICICNLALFILIPVAIYSTA